MHFWFPFFAILAHFFVFSSPASPVAQLPLTVLAQLDSNFERDVHYRSLVEEETAVRLKWASLKRSGLSPRALREVIIETLIWDGEGTPDRSAYEVLGPQVKSRIEAWHRFQIDQFDPYNRRKTIYLTQTFYQYFQQVYWALKEAGDDVTTRLGWEATLTLHESEIAAEAAYREFIVHIGDFGTEDDWRPRHGARDFFTALDSYLEVAGRYYMSRAELQKWDRTPVLAKLIKHAGAYAEKRGRAGMAKLITDPASDALGYVGNFFSVKMFLEGWELPRVARSRVPQFSPFNGEEKPESYDVNLFILPHYNGFLDTATLGALRLPHMAVITSATTWGKELGLTEEEIRNIIQHDQFIVVSNGDSGALRKIKRQLQSGKLHNIVLLPEGSRPSGLVYAARQFQLNSVTGLINILEKSKARVNVIPTELVHNFRLREDEAYLMPGDQKTLSIVFEPSLPHFVLDFLRKIDDKTNPHLLDAFLRAFHLYAIDEAHPDRVVGSLPVDFAHRQLWNYSFGRKIPCRKLVTSEAVIF